METTSNFNRWSLKVLHYAQYKTGILTFTFWHSPQHNKSQPYLRNSQLPIQLTLQWAVADFQKLLPQQRNWCASSLTQSQWFTRGQLIKLFDIMHITQLHTTSRKLAVGRMATWQHITVTGLDLEYNITVPQQEKMEISFFWPTCLNNLLRLVTDYEATTITTAHTSQYAGFPQWCCWK